MNVNANDSIEWQFPRVEPLSVPGLYIHDDADGLEIVVGHGTPEFEKYKIDSWDRDGIHGVMAIANHCLGSGDSRKITREDVGMILKTADREEENAGYHTGGNSYRSPLRSIADKLAALLPPEAK